MFMSDGFHLVHVIILFSTHASGTIAVSYVCPLMLYDLEKSNILEKYLIHSVAHGDLKTHKKIIVRS